MARVALVTDSTSYIPPDVVQKHNLTIVPQVVIWDNQTLEDGVDIQPTDFYRRLSTSKTMPTTSQVSVLSMHNAFSKLLSEGYEVLGMFLSAKLSGTMQHAEREMLQGVFWLGDRLVNQIMTPRTRVVWLDVTAEQDEVLNTIEQSHFTTFPVAEGSLDHVLGTIDVKVLLPGAVRTQTLDLRHGLKPPLMVPETIPAVRLIAMFQQSRNHMAIAVDEHGNTQGIITLTDILEAIVGDIPAPGQPEPPSAVRRDDGSWLVDGIMPLVELKDLLRNPLIPEPPDVTTVAGLVVAELGRIPMAGDTVMIAGFEFEVVDMDGVRVDKVLIRPGEPDLGHA